MNIVVLGKVSYKRLFLVINIYYIKNHYKKVLYDFEKFGFTFTLKPYYYSNTFVVTQPGLWGSLGYH